MYVCMYLDLPRELIYALHVEVKDDGVLVRLFAIRADEVLFQSERRINICIQKFNKLVITYIHTQTNKNSCKN